MGDYLIFSYIKLIVFLTGVQLNKNSNEDTISCTFSRPQVGLFKNELHLWLCNFLASLILVYCPNMGKAFVRFHKSASLKE